MGNQHGIYHRCVAGHCILISISNGVSKVVDAERVLLNIINVLIFCLFKLQRGACALSFQVLKTVYIFKQPFVCSWCLRVCFLNKTLRSYCTSIYIGRYLALFRFSFRKLCYSLSHSFHNFFLFSTIRTPYCMLALMFVERCVGD